MDDRLQKALDHAQYSMTVFQQTKLLKLRYENDLMYSSNGGTFRADASLLCFVDLLIRRGEKDAIIMSMKNDPIFIPDLEAFQNSLWETHHMATNAYYADRESLKKARNVKTVVGL